MTVGDTVEDLQTIADTARLTIQPVAGVEWAINNIIYGGAVALHRVKGAIDLAWDSDTGTGGRLGYVFNLTNTNYIEVENTSGGDIAIGYDGLVTKEP